MDRKRMIAVSTFCSWASYGSMLQSYALKKILKSLGYDSYILIDRKVITPDVKCRIPRTINAKALVSGYLNRRLKKSLISQYNKNTKFMRDNIDIIYYNNYEELSLNHLKADYYLSGSDQVLNPKNPLPGFYFDYISDKSKLLTYACSMGNTDIDSNKEETFKRLLNNFNRISVRESNTIPVLKKYNPTASYETHIDPTFLLDVAEWRKLEKEYNIDGEYILLFPLYWDKKFDEQVKRLKKKTGLKVIGVFASGFNSIYCDKKLYDVGVDEFLWLIDHAKAVITSSFHGAALSAAFEKKVCIVTNPNMSSRLDNFVEMFSFPKCEIEDVLSLNIDYENVKRVILAEREKSIKYLEEILSDE